MAIFAGAAVFFAVKAERTLSTLVLGGIGESFSTRIWSAPFPVRDQSAADAEALIESWDDIRIHMHEVYAIPQFPFQ